MYGIGGERELTERTLDHLSGWWGARPVRVGTGVWNQRQHDVWGMLLDAVDVQFCRKAAQIPWPLWEGLARFAEPGQRDDDERARRWQAGADQIRAEVLDKGVSQRGVLWQHYQTDDLDASLLLLLLMGFLPASDDRIRETVLGYRNLHYLLVLAGIGAGLR